MWTQIKQETYDYILFPGTNKDSVSTAVSMLANIPKKVSAIDSKEDDEEDLSSLMNNK